ncbi:hypothetical protein [Acinetobacter sp. NyZ410]|uniref:hypothetical protein n=1 Tax=Acinetobacter sp. NyZ410 TaxID=2929509 RepID=UPI001FB960FF|nr:hypothetical protein [Acinetobacter sp. NyZ410]UOH16925.1 hypothetical protein MTO68_13925 [Acinetobacter sp. NyZ410]
MFENHKKNQHFISVAEQRLNASNTGVAGRDKAKIFSFEVVDRAKHIIKLTAQGEIKAVKNLYFIDLYTFELISLRDRANLEDLFTRIEQHASISTNEILDNSSFKFEHFMNVFKLKLLNVFRNPYCISFTLLCFDNLINMEPVDNNLNKYFSKIDTHNYPVDMMQSFGVSEHDYKKWLKVIFLLTVPIKKDWYLLDEIANNFFTSKESYHQINLFTYTNQNCLLSDRSFINLTPLSNFKNDLFLGFNLRKDAFMYIHFIREDLGNLIKEMYGADGDNIVKRLNEAGIKKLQKGMQINKTVDNYEALKAYNRHVIFQCHKNIFSANSSVLV